MIMIPNPNQWLNEAKENLELARSLFDKNPRWAYFIAWQSAELSLKAVLISLGNPGFESFKHDLIKVWKQGLNKSPSFDEVDINHFGIEKYPNLRYPNKRVEEIREEKSKEVIDSAQNILNVSRKVCNSIVTKIDKIMGWERKKITCKGMNDS